MAEPFERYFYLFERCVKEQYSKMTAEASFRICTSRLFPKDEGVGGSSEGEPADGRGREVEANPESQHITPVNTITNGDLAPKDEAYLWKIVEPDGAVTYATPEQAAEIEKMPHRPSFTKYTEPVVTGIDGAKLTVERKPFIPRIADFALAMAPPGGGYTEPEKRGEWDVEPTQHVPWDKPVLKSGKRKRKAAEAEAQRLANETGIPWRIVRWWGRGHGMVDNRGESTEFDTYVARTEGGYMKFTHAGDAKAHCKERINTSRSRCRITRTFHPEAK